MYRKDTLCVHKLSLVYLQYPGGKKGKKNKIIINLKKSTNETAKKNKINYHLSHGEILDSLITCLLLLMKTLSPQCLKPWLSDLSSLIY